MTPAVVICPILLPTASVNHSAPSGPAVMPLGCCSPWGRVNSVMTPAVVIRPILLPVDSVNHSAPSGPAVMARGALVAVGMANSCDDARSGDPPDLVARCVSVNHSAPSGPAVMPMGLLVAVGTANSVMAPAVVIRPILLP